MTEEQKRANIIADYLTMIGMGVEFEPVQPDNSIELIVNTYMDMYASIVIYKQNRISVYCPVKSLEKIVKKYTIIALQQLGKVNSQ